jgi:gliding motility-associated-like protein
MRLTTDNGLILGTMSYSDISGSKTEASRGDRDYWIIKLDSNGILEWDKTLGGDNLDQTQSIVQAKDGGFVTVGWSRSNISGDKTENKSGLQDFWVVKIKVCSQNLSATSNSPICENKAIQFNATGGTNYFWKGPNGFTSTDQNPTISNATAINSGQYSCNITGTGGCDTLKLVDVIIDSQPLPAANSPQQFCFEQNPTLNDIVITGQDIKWYGAITGGTNLLNSTFLQNGINYFASQTINGCESNRILINTPITNDLNCGTIIDIDNELVFPKFFTPNGDGYNDTWKIKSSSSENGLALKIFDRFGKLIKELDANSNGWDGTYTGQPLPSTDYWFVVTRKNGKEHKGHFSLKR